MIGAHKQNLETYIKQMMIMSAATTAAAATRSTTRYIMNSSNKSKSTILYALFSSSHRKQIPNKYEFPMRDEMPTITRSKASDLENDEKASIMALSSSSSDESDNGEANRNRHRIVSKELDSKHGILNEAPVYIKDIMDKYQEELALNAKDPPQTIVSTLGTYDFIC